MSRNDYMRSAAAVLPYLPAVVLADPEIGALSCDLTFHLGDCVLARERHGPGWSGVVRGTAGLCAPAADGGAHQRPGVAGCAEGGGPEGPQGVRRAGGGPGGTRLWRASTAPVTCCRFRTDRAITGRWMPRRMSRTERACRSARPQGASQTLTSCSYWAVIHPSACSGFCSSIRSVNCAKTAAERESSIIGMSCAVITVS